MKQKKILSILAAASLLMAIGSGCGGNTDTVSSESPTSSSSVELLAADMFTDSDLDASWDASTAVSVALSDTGSTASADSVKIDGSTITLSEEGTYVLSGSLSNGQIVVEAPKTAKLQVVLNGVTISSETSAAIYVKQADKVFLTLADGSVNTLSTSNEYVAIDDNNIDSVIFAKEDLTVNGTGSLSISSAFGHGIVSKDDLVIANGTYTIATASHGLAGKDSVRIADGSFTITSGKDGIHAENADDATLGFLFVADGTFDITAQTDGFDAASVLQIEGGSYHLVTGGGSANAVTTKEENQRPNFGERRQQGTTSEATSQVQAAPTAQAEAQTPAESAESTDTAADTPSTKGLKAGSDLIVKAGSFVIDSADDTLHSNANVLVQDGDFTLTSGDDGIHADTNTTISGGTIQITKSYEGIEGQSIDITGGTISITASDDGLNAAGGNDSSGATGRPGGDTFTADADCYIHISGGKIEINASGDGVDSNGSLTVSGGETYVNGPVNDGNGALDYDGSANITGGIFIATGSSGMAQNFGSSSTQGSILVNSQNKQAAGTTVTLTDASGKTIATVTPQKQYNSVLISTPDIQKDATYTLQIGDEEAQSISMTELIYGSGGGMQGGGQGGQRGPGGQGGTQGTPPEAPNTSGGTVSGGAPNETGGMQPPREQQPNQSSSSASAG